MTGNVIHRYFRACTIGAAMFGVNIGCDAASDAVDERSVAEQDSSEDAGDEHDCDKDHKGGKGKQEGDKAKHKGDEPCDGDKPPPPKQDEPRDPEAGTGSESTGEPPDDGTGEPPDDSTSTGDESTGGESTGTPIPQ